jgi:Arabinose efflux permease
MLQNLYDRYYASFAGLSPVIWLLSLVTLINRAGTMVIPFMTIYLTNQLSFSTVQTGYIMACFGAGSLAGSYLGGKLTDWIGYFQTMFWSLFLGGFMFFLLLYQKEFYAVAIVIFLVSLVIDLFRPALFSAVAIFSPEKDRTRSISLIRLAINLGFGVGPAFGGLIAEVYGFSWLFIVDGVTCISAGLFVWWKIPRNVKPQHQETENTQIPTSIFKDGIYLGFLLLTTLVGIIFMQLIFLIPVYLKDILQFSEAHVGYLMALNGLLIFAVEMPLVHHCDSRKTNLYWVMVGTGMVSLSYLFLVIPGTGLAWYFLPILFMITISIGEIFMFPFTNSFAYSRSNDQNRGSYMGYYSMAFSISLIIAPIIGFQIANWLGYDMLFYFLAGGGLLLVLGFGGLKRWVKVRG